MRKVLLIPGMLLVVITALALAAQAAAGGNGTTTFTGQFRESGQFLDEGATTACGFPVTFTYDTLVKYAFVFDAAGNFHNAAFIPTGTATESANGITLSGQIADNQIYFGPTQQVFEVGLVDNLRLPHGGVVQRDVGRIVWSFDAWFNGGPPTVVEGPHQALEGDDAALCAALTP